MKIEEKAGPEIELRRTLGERIAWLVRLRWVAISAVIVTVYSVPRIFKIELFSFQLYSVAFLLACYNLIFTAILLHSRKKNYFSEKAANISAIVQIAFDLTALAGLIHFAGGIENPFIFYFIFHTIIASILLSRKPAFLEASYAIFLFFC